MSDKKTGDLSNISDILIVRKITEKDLSHIPKKAFDEDSSEENERDLLVEEHEAIVRKQHQMLQADERGKEALYEEIAAIKQKQEKRAETIKFRQHALQIEKERARKIASLPPPLPKSVKLLLQKPDEPKPSKPDAQMPEELKTVAITPVLFDKDENKENVMNSEEMEAKKRIQEGWNLKARTRFNEALKKERQKEEYANIMKQIQNAEMQNRREMAKNISSEKSRNVPCPLSDKFQASKKQIDMEDTAEKLFKENVKEHVIEEIEGYQDYYETKYKRIDSELESKLIDCVPSFVKENYQYLLEDESKFQGGKNFSGLDDSGSDLLNQAYIETPPHDEDGGGKIDLVIDRLDKLRSRLQTEYDQTLKPLLVASMEVPPKALSDKAVETDFFKQPCEDKSVETDKPIESQPTPSFISNFQRPRIFTYEKRHESFLPSFGVCTVPDMHRRDVHYPLPAVPLSEGLEATSWSSSYCSLPSKHGFPIAPGSSECCDICVVERENKLVEDTQHSEFPRCSSTLSNGIRVNSLINKDLKACEKISPKEKSALSGYVQQLAKKYLEPKSALSDDLQLEEDKKPLGDFPASEYSTPEEISPAFEKEKIGRHMVDSPQIVSHELTKLSSVLEVTGKSGAVLYGLDKIVGTSKMNESKGDHIINKKSETYEVGEKLNAYNVEGAKSPECTNDYSEYDAEVKRLQIIQQVLSRRIPELNFNSSPKPVHQGNVEQTDFLISSTGNVRGEMPCKPHVYHELSTIHEADSALTGGSLQLSQSGLSFEKSLETADKEKFASEKYKEILEESTEKLKMVSLLDLPDSKISELAKSIHFVAESPEEIAKPFKVSKSLPSESSDASISSKESLTPSHTSRSTSSPLFSNEKIYSSSLAENNVKFSHLTSTETLPKYFKDISGIQQKDIFKSEISLKSSVPSSYNSPFSSSSTSIPSIIDTGIKASGHESSSHPSVSGFISNNKTPCRRSFDSNLESSTNLPLVSGFISDMRATGISSSISSHEPTTRHPLVSGFINEIKAPDMSSPDSFHPMTPHSDISSPDIKKSGITELSKYDKDNNQIVTSNKDESFRYEYASSSESGIFRPMTPYSNISSPNMVTQSKQQIYADSSAESFKPLSPKSMISSPSLSGDDSAFKRGNTSAGSSKFKPVTFRFTIPVPLPISSASVQKPKIKRMPELQFCPKSQISKIPNPMQLSKVPEKEVKSTCILDDEGKAYLDSQSTYQEQKKNVSGETKSKQLSHTCSSDFFVPQICASDVSSPQTQSQDFDLLQGSLTKSCQKEEQLISQSDSELSKTSNSSSGRSANKFNDLKYSSAESVASCETKLKEGFQNFAGRRYVDAKKLGFLDSELSRGLRKQHSSLQTISSASSSSENLSDMFSGSKILFQSTPIKSMEELAQEKGILEEPDLTLMATQITCIPDSSELPRDLSHNTTNFAPVNTNLENITLLTSPSECKTPSNQSPKPSSSSDTPSMLSFLHHELSCMQREISPDEKSSSLVKDENSASEASRAQNEGQKNQRFLRVGYKQRTKRLWNNLEEVRKRNLAEERKKISSINRLKAKEYGKKLTPKRKGN